MKSILKVLFWLSIAVALLIVFLFETDVLLPGRYADEVNGQFVVASVAELLTVVSIPLVVRMLRFRVVKADVMKGKYMKWALVRLSLLAILMVVNTLLYYIYMNVAFGYMAIIVLISMVFIYPSEARMKRETALEE